MKRDSHLFRPETEVERRRGLSPIFPRLQKPHPHVCRTEKESISAPCGEIKEINHFFSGERPFLGLSLTIGGKIKREANKCIGKSGMKEGGET